MTFPKGLLRLPKRAITSPELQAENREPFNKASVPAKVVGAEVEGTVSASPEAVIEDEKTLKRRSRSLPDLDLHFDHAITTVGAKNTGFTRRGSPAGLKAGPSSARKSFFIEPQDDATIMMRGGAAPWKRYIPDTKRESVYRPYIQTDLEPTTAEESPKSEDLEVMKARKLRNRNHYFYIPARENHNQSEEVSLSELEQAKKAQKLKNRISSGFMPDQTPLTEVIIAATDDTLILTETAETKREVDPPVSSHEAVTTACEQKTAPTTFDEILGTPANEVDELHRRSSESRTHSDSTSSVQMKLVEPAPATFQTLRRVRAAKVELRSLARPIQPGESANTDAASSSLLDAPIPTTLTTSRSSKLVVLTPTPTEHAQTKNEDIEISWDWPRFVDKDFEDPAVAHSKRFREKKAWEKKNTGPLLAFEKHGWSSGGKRGGDGDVEGEAKTEEKVDQKRWSWRDMGKKSVGELMDLFEGR